MYASEYWAFLAPNKFVSNPIINLEFYMGNGDAPGLSVGKSVKKLQKNDRFQAYQKCRNIPKIPNVFGRQVLISK